MSAAAPAQPPAPPPLAIETRDFPHPWMRAFLEAMAVSPNVSAAARRAGISREYAYEAARNHPEFRKAWIEAKEVGLDLAEQIVFQRGTGGHERTVVRTKTIRDAAGALVLTETTETTETVISNALLISWLRANRPEKWAERVDHRHGGNPELPPVIHDVTLRRAPDRLAALLLAARDDPGIAAILDATVGPDGVARVNGDTPDSE